MNECPACKQGAISERLVESWMRKDGKWVLFKNVPATACDLCGETAFSQEVAERLAKILLLDNLAVFTDFVYRPEIDLKRLDLERSQGKKPLVSAPTIETINADILTEKVHNTLTKDEILVYP